MRYDLTLDDDCDSRLTYSIRVRRAIDTLGCWTIRDILKHPPKVWLALPNFGKGSLATLVQALERHGGHKLPPNSPPKPPPEPKPEPKPKKKRQRLSVPPPPPESKVICSSAPRAVLDRNRSDEVLDVAVRLVRAIQVYRRTKAKKDLQQVLQHEKGMRLYFPSLSREEAQRLAHVLVHVGSLSLRHALGMTVAVPGSQEGLEAAPEFSRDSQGRQLNVRLEDGSMVATEDALLLLFKEHSRLTAREAFNLMRDRGWTFLHKHGVKSHIGSIRDRMNKSPLFHRCKAKRQKQTFGGKGGYIVFRVA